MSQETDAAWSKFEAASKKLHNPKGGPSAEKEYSDAYKQLVRLGEVLPLKGKYRGR